MKAISRKYTIFVFVNCICGFFLYSTKSYFCCYISGNEKNVKLEEVQQNSFFFEEYVQDDPLFNCDHINTQITHEKAEESAMKYCASDKILPKTLEKLPKKLRQILLGHIIVNDEYKFLYCFTPKVACSNWKKVMKMLYGNFKQEEWVKMDHLHGFTFLNSFNDTEINRRLRTYFKFMFVRNPAERAISVYRNKFNDIEAFYKVYGKKIMSLYHKDSPKYKGKVEGDDVAFKDFLRYIANDVEPEYMNEHYMPMTTLCQPCLVNYDFIGIYDNLVEDSETVLRKINAPEDIHFPSRQSWYKPTTDIFTQYYFSHVPPKLLQEYLLKYALDFKMFSFPLPYFQKKFSYHSNNSLCLQ